MNNAHSARHLREHFLRWQCRIREHAMRHHGGRPSPGMRPRVMGPDGREIIPAVTIVLVEAEPAESTAQFCHIVRRTHDPEDRYREALQTLASAYYQHPENFSDVMTALFSVDSTGAEKLSPKGRCVLEFEQFSQSYHIPCAVAALVPDHPAYQATYWHNQMFNPNMPGIVRILAYTPEWQEATAFPPV